MFGKTFIYYDEAETIFTKNNASLAVAQLKTWSTAEQITYMEKHKSSFSAMNNHTIWLLCNDASNNSDEAGRRYFTLDVSIEKKGNEPYFKKLYSCFTKDVGNCFYSYLMDEVKIPYNWIADTNIPISNNKKDAIAERLEKPLVFIKRNYLLQNLSIDMKLSELHSEYLADGKFTKITNIAFNKIIKQCELYNYTSGWTHVPKIKIEHSDLRKLYVKNNWLHETDEFSEEQEHESVFGGEY
jgi:hypothetical protein